MGLVTISSFAALVDEEAPAGAELLGGGFVEELLEVGEAAEVLGDLGGDVAGGFAAAVGLHDLPEHGVVDVAAAVVADDAADVLGDGARCLSRSSGGFLAELGVLFDGAVQVGDIGLVVLVVVELHGRLVDGGLESGVVVRKRRKFEGHGSYSFIVLGFRRCARSSATSLGTTHDNRAWMHGVRPAVLPG